MGLRHHLKTLRLPTMLSEYAKLSREAAEKDESYESYLLRLGELEVNQPGANAIMSRVQRVGPDFQGERMTAALLDRFTHRCHIFEMNGESYRFRESSKQAKEKKGGK